MSLTVACVRVQGKGKRKYPIEYVEKLKAMVERHIDRPFRMVCLTNKPDEVPAGIEPVKIKKPRGLRGWWSKIHLFDPAMPFDERVLYLDLDVLVLGSLAGIVDFPARFAIAPDMAPAFRGQPGKRVVKGYNSSVMVWDHRARREIFETWTWETASRLWSDQDFVKLTCPYEATFPPEWFDRLIKSPPRPDAKVMLCIKTKNHDAAERFPWFAPLWG